MLSVRYSTSTRHYTNLGRSTTAGHAHLRELSPLVHLVELGTDYFVHILCASRILVEPANIRWKNKSNE